MYVPWICDRQEPPDGIFSASLHLKFTGEELKLIQDLPVDLEIWSCDHNFVKYSRNHNHFISAAVALGTRLFEKASKIVNTLFERAETLCRRVLKGPNNLRPLF